MTDWGWDLPPGCTMADINGPGPEVEYDPPERRCMACDRRMLTGAPLCPACQQELEARR